MDIGTLLVTIVTVLGFLGTLCLAGYIFFLRWIDTIDNAFNIDEYLADTDV